MKAYIVTVETAAGKNSVTVMNESVIDAIIQVARLIGTAQIISIMGKPIISIMEKPK